MPVLRAIIGTSCALVCACRMLNSFTGHTRMYNCCGRQSLPRSALALRQVLDIAIGKSAGMYLLFRNAISIFRVSITEHSKPLQLTVCSAYSGRVLRPESTSIGSKSQ
eukprot:6198405-Pleurochrysis_carterae.AAC.3